MTPGSLLCLEVNICLVFSFKSITRQAHLTLGLVEKHSDGQFVLKALKQKLYVDGLCYLLQVLKYILNVMLPK